MSAESDIRDVLVAYAPLSFIVSAGSISIDAVDADAPRPYIAFSKSGTQRDLGLDNGVLAETRTVDIQCIGINRAQSIQIADLVFDALQVAGNPSDRGGAAYDGDNDIELEVVTVDWVTV